MEDRSFQDLLAEFANSLFIGRVEQLKEFERGLTAARPPFLILAIAGQGGVGKTTILDQFVALATASHVPVGLVNEYQANVPAILGELSRRLKASDDECTEFDARYKRYLQLRRDVEIDKAAPTHLDSAVGHVTRIGVRGLSFIPGVGPLAGMLGRDLEDAAGSRASAFARYVTQKFSSTDDRALLLDTDRTLTEAFVVDINRIAERARLILMFDTYEETAPAIETWLQDLLVGRFGSFRRVLVVIAGRSALGQSWSRFKGAIQQIVIEPFTNDEAALYLDAVGITDHEQRRSLIKLSGGLPVLLALLTSSAAPTAEADVSDDAVERFLQGAAPEQREAALLCAVPRWFNEDVVRLVLGDVRGAEVFEWLRRAHFIRATPLVLLCYKIVI